MNRLQILVLGTLSGESDLAFCMNLKKLVGLQLDQV
jgi:hypothetical protein